MMLRTYALGLVAGLMLMGCTGLTPGRNASTETLTTATATVEAVDMSTRAVTLRDDAGGGTFTVTAGPEVRNLDQVAPGDRVTIDYYQSTTVSMADPSDTGEPMGGVVAARAPEGARPGGMAAVSESMVVTVVSYDRSTGLATFRTPDGFTRRATVPPELRQFADTRGPGSRVLITMTEAVAVSVTEQPAA
jgi:hypothetical protein